MPTVSFKTLGCRLNQAETAQMAASFEKDGYRVVDSGAQADVCVVHTCTVTATAEAKCVRFARSARQHSPRSVLVMAGCAAERAGSDLLSRAGADLVVGQADKYRIPELIARREASIPPRAEARAGTEPTSADALPPAGRTRALLKVQDGCDFRCAYCIVPSVRGAPRSRPFAEVLTEARRLAEAGFPELVLTGANLGTYRDGSRTLLDVLKAVEDVEGPLRIRLSSIEISTVEHEIVEHMAGSQKLCRFLHLPLQSGDDGVLARMGRRYRVADYVRCVEDAVRRVPGLGLGADVMVGFPGETEAAYRNTAELLRALPFSNLHVFPYSRRPGTPAAEMPGQVPDAVRRARCRELLALGDGKRDAFARAFVGRDVHVLVEKVTSAGEGRGWTSEYVEAHVMGPATMRGTIRTFIPVGSEGGVLRGESLH